MISAGAGVWWAVGRIAGLQLLNLNESCMEHCDKGIIVGLFTKDNVRVRLRDLLPHRGTLGSFLCLEERVQ